METRLRRDSEPSQITSRRPPTDRILGAPASRQFLRQPNQLGGKLLSRAPQPGAGRLFARPPDPSTPSHIPNRPNRPQNPVLPVLRRDGPRAVAVAVAAGHAAALPLSLHHRGLELVESPRESRGQNRPIDLEQGLGPLPLVLIDEPLGQGPDGLVLAGAHGDVVDDDEELRQRAGDAGVARAGGGRREGPAAGRRGRLRGLEGGGVAVAEGGARGGEEGREEAEEEEEGGEEEVAEELEEAVLLGEAEEGLVGEDEGGGDEVAEEERGDGGEGVECFHGGRVAGTDWRVPVHGGGIYLGGQGHTEG